MKGFQTGLSFMALLAAGCFARLPFFRSRSYFLASASSSSKQANEAVSGSTSTERLGVLFLNLGGPDNVEDVEGFLYNLFADPDIIRLPSYLSFLQKPLAFTIAKTRRAKSSAAYARIGGGSPILNYTRQQTNGVQQRLRSRRDTNDVLWSRTNCYFAMRYSKPFTEEVLDEIARDGVTKLVILPLYPQYSISTSGSSLKLLEQLIQSNPSKYSFTHTTIPLWYDRPKYVKLVADLITEQLDKFLPEELDADGGTVVLFSAHGVPESYILEGDPYQKHMEECVSLIANKVIEQKPELLLSTPTNNNSSSSSSSDEKTVNDSEAEATLDLVLDKRFSSTILDFSSSNISESVKARNIQFHLSYQSRVGPVQWLRPYTDETIKHFGKAGLRNLLVVPISFVSEHIETLEEIDIEYRKLAENNNISHWERVEAPNLRSEFLDELANLVEEAVRSPALSITQAVSQMEDVTKNTAGSAFVDAIKQSAAEKNVEQRKRWLTVVGVSAYTVSAVLAAVRMFPWL